MTAEPTNYTIIVTGTPHEWSSDHIRYADVVTLFDPAYPQHPEVTFSVTYHKGPRANPEGILSQGAGVEIKDRMEFRVSRTGQS